MFANKIMLPFVLIAALFPGVTSKSLDEHSGEAGMGLYQASDTAVIETGGSMTIRTGYHRCEISKADSKLYGERALAIKVERSLTRFKGNLIRVDVRLNDVEDDES